MKVALTLLLKPGSQLVVTFETHEEFERLRRWLAKHHPELVFTVSYFYAGTELKESSVPEAEKLADESVLQKL